jgi:hypothetical protein
MSVELRPLSELNQHATAILVREMGLVDTLRFLSQFSTGSGDYTKERGQWLDELSLEQITSEESAHREQPAKNRGVFGLA